MYVKISLLLLILNSKTVKLFGGCSSDKHNQTKLLLNLKEVKKKKNTDKKVKIYSKGKQNIKEIIKKDTAIFKIKKNIFTKTRNINKYKWTLELIGLRPQSKQTVKGYMPLLERK